MDKVEISAKPRVEKSNIVRAKGQVPAIVYGKGFEPVQIEVESKMISKLFGSNANQNVLIGLNIDDGGKITSFPVLAHEMQIDAISDKILHVDFIKVNMAEEIKTKVHVVLVGEPAGVKLEGGILIQSMRVVEVKSLPGDIPEKIEADVSKLKSGESMHVSALVAPKGVTIVSDAEDVIAMVVLPTEEEVVAAPVEAAVVVAGPAATTGAPGAAAPTADAKDAKAPAADAKGKPAAKPSK